MIRKTKKGSRRLREMPVIRTVECVWTDRDLYGGYVRAGVKYPTLPGIGEGSRLVPAERPSSPLYILLQDCSHLGGGNWNVEMRKEYL